MARSGCLFTHYYTNAQNNITNNKAKEKPALPNSAGTISAACHKTSNEFTGFWYLNKSLKRGYHWDERYLQCAVPPVTHWAKSEISAYKSRTVSKRCQQSILECVQKLWETERSKVTIETLIKKKLLLLPNTIYLFYQGFKKYIYIYLGTYTIKTNLHQQKYIQHISEDKHWQ